MVIAIELMVYINSFKVGFNNFSRIRIGKCLEISMILRKDVQNDIEIVCCIE